ncbi:hypothetical protein [Nodularia sp. UHCC 0506]|uniref:hypothetical protein n=1 Tax=Nodularia sp. UHCC 0506 TaxID=3110243 RepID=UPI002B20847F|nr:hypothetical protein [Nodularia sp. UHCC 0506]MEA5516992.1 hypothetical protein [Nodularia sp. UHCC 0506]
MSEKKKSFDRYQNVLLLFLMISLSCCSYSIGEEGNYKSNGANNKMEKQESENKQPLIIRGEVKSINRLNIDKSGRNPKYQININLAPTSIEGAELGSDSNSLLILQSRETEILEQMDRLPIVGDNLIIESFSNEEAPRMLPIKKIKFQ